MTTSTPQGGVTVVLASGTVYTVPGGLSWTEAPAITGDLMSVVVFGEEPEDGSEPPKLASFANAETAYAAGAVTSAAAHGL